MSNKTIVKTLRVDPEFGAKIEAELERLGLSFSEAVRRGLCLLLGLENQARKESGANGN